MRLETDGICINGTFYHIPELSSTIKFDQKNPEHHPEKFLWTHIVQTASQVIPSPELFLVAVFHDLGKLYTGRIHSKDPARLTFIGHEHVSARMFLTYMRHYSFPVNAAEVYWIIKNHMRINNFSEMRPFKRQELMDSKYFNNLVIFNKADRKRCQEIIQ